MVTGLLWMGGVLIALGWFAIGWVARGQENRKYAESRLRALVSQSVPAAPDVVAASAQRVEPAPPVINVVFPPNLAAAAGYHHPHMVLGDHIRHLPPAEPINLDQL